MTKTRSERRDELLRCLESECRLLLDLAEAEDWKAWEAAAGRVEALLQALAPQVDATLSREERRRFEDARRMQTAAAASVREKRQRAFEELSTAAKGKSAFEGYGRAGREKARRRLRISG